LVLGIISFLTSCCWFLGIPLAVGGLVCGAIGMKNEEGKGMAIAGLILSILGLLVSGAWLLVIIAGGGLG
jgi:hypothetical protein